MNHYRPETEEAREAFFARAIAFWRSHGYAYVTLSVRGTANPHRAGVLAHLIALVANNPGAQLVELAAPDAKQQILKWARRSRPITTKGFN